MYMIQIDMGDISGDGHNNRDTFIASSTHKLAAVQDFLRTANNALGGNIFDSNMEFTFCSDYEDCSIPDEFTAMLEVCPVNDKDWMTPNCLFGLWMDLAMYGAKLAGVEFHIEEANSTDVETIEIGGYGLYA